MKQKYFNIRIGSNFEKYNISIYQRNCLVLDTCIVNKSDLEFCIISCDNIFVNLSSPYGDKKSIYLKYFEDTIYQIAFYKNKSESIQTFTFKDNVYGLNIPFALLTFNN